MNWIRIPITNDDMKLAKKYAEEEISNMKFEPLFQTTDYIKDHYLGQLGEIKFHHWLQSKEIIHKFVNDLSGFSDNGIDFIINKYKIDVKSAQCSTPINKINHNYRFFIPAQQLKNHNQTDFYVSMQLAPDENAIYLMGVIHRDVAGLSDVMKYSNNINKAYNVPMIDLIPPEIWLESIVTENDKEISLNDFHF